VRAQSEADNDIRLTSATLVPTSVQGDGMGMGGPVEPPQEPASAPAVVKVPAPKVSAPKPIPAPAATKVPEEVSAQATSAAGKVG
jgi:hypothetical protein